jgi:hypothetical protein
MDKLLLSPNVLAEGNNLYFLDNYFPHPLVKNTGCAFLGLPPLMSQHKILRLGKKRGVGLYAAIPAQKCRGYPLPSLMQLFLIYEQMSDQWSELHF